MAKYEIETPQGRKAVIEAEKMPTDEDIREYFNQKDTDELLGMLGSIDKGSTFGFGRKVLSGIGAIGSYPVDRIAQAMGKENTPSFLDRYHEYEKFDLDKTNKFAEENPGSAIALELAGSVVNPLNKVGVGYIKGANTVGGKAIRSGLVGSGIGGISGVGRSENLEELPENVATDTVVGGVMGGAMPYAEKGIGKLWKSTRGFLDPAYAVKDKAKGLGNIAKDNDSMRILKRGIQASDDVANQVAEQTPVQLNALNTEIGNKLENSLKGRVNYDENIIAQKQKWADYAYPKLDEQLVNVGEKNNLNYKIKNMSSDELKRSLEQIDINKLRSVSPVKGLGREEYADIIKKQAKDLGVEIFDDGSGKINSGVMHFVVNKNNVIEPRANYVESLKDTYNNPNITIEKGNEKNLIALLKDITNDKRKIDNLVTRDDKLLTKYQIKMKQLVDKLQDPDTDNLSITPDILNDMGISPSLEYNATNNISVSGRVLEPTGAGYIRPALKPNANITPKTINVNSNLPKLSVFTKDLTPTAKKEFNGFIAQGLADSKNKAGSLGSIHKALQYANKRIDSVIHEDPLRPKPKNDPDVSRLMSVKDAINKILERGGIKPFDKNIAKAEGLKSMYEQGYKFNPSDVKFNYANVNTNEEKQAFLTGFVDKITDDVRDGKNLADAVRKNENVFKNLMSNNEYKGLLKEANRISTEYERINDLSKMAKKQLVKPEPVGRPSSELLESKGAFLGGMKDKALAKLFKNSNTKKSQYLLNGGGKTNSLADLLERQGAKMSPSDYTAYLVQALSQNQ